MRCLVLGGTGFVGRALVLHLLQKGHEVGALCRRGEDLPASVKVFRADRKQASQVKTALDGERFEAVFDIQYLPTTATDVRRIIEAVSSDVAHYVFCSTALVYSHTGAYPITEDAPRNPKGKNYAGDKIECEDLLFHLHQEVGFPATIIRPAIVYGPRNPLYREAFTFDRLVRNRPILLPDSHQRRLQLGYVDDLAKAFESILGNARVLGKAYNVTGRELVTPEELVQICGEAVGGRPKILKVPPKTLQKYNVTFGESMDFPFDMGYALDAARRDLGVQAALSLRDGLHQTFVWYQRNTGTGPGPDFSREDRLLQRMGRHGLLETASEPPRQIFR